MRILFVMPLALPAYLFQLAALTSFLRSRGHQAAYTELVIDGDLNERHFAQLKKRIADCSPQVIGFSSYEMSFSWITELSDYIKKANPQIKIIVGGYYSTLAPQEVIKHSSIDIICVGEGEYPLLELMESLRDKTNRRDINNLWFKENGKVISNPVRELIGNLDELPFVDRELFTSENKKNGILEIMASRGCPFDCTNCSNHALKEIYSGKGAYLRYRSVNNVLAEIKQCLEKEKIKLVEFEDDMFTANKKWLMEFCGKYREQVGLPFICNIRPESGTFEVLKLLKDAGCSQVSVGVEAGDETIRRKVLCRNMPDKLIIDVFKNAKKAGLKRKSFNMVGLPYETPKTLLRTIWLNLKIAPDGVQTSVYYPFKGTVLGDECYRNGWVDLERKKRLKLYADDSILKLPTVSRNAIRSAKWLNSSTVLRSGNLRILKTAFLEFTKKIRRFLKI